MLSLPIVTSAFNLIRGFYFLTEDVYSYEVVEQDLNMLHHIFEHLFRVTDNTKSIALLNDLNRDKCNLVSQTVRHDFSVRTPKSLPGVTVMGMRH